MTGAGQRPFPMWILNLFEAPLPEDFREALKSLRVKAKAHGEG
jgi:hypothetical protein